MSERKVVYTLEINSNAKQIFSEAETQALRFESAMQNVNNTMRLFGLGFAGEAVISWGKQWLQSSADYETAMMRIANASKTVKDGIYNQSWILGEVDKYKLNLQESIDAYGRFLAMLGNSDLAGEKVRQLHDELLGIGKALALPQSTMDSTVFDLGKLLGEGVLEARSIRMLERVFPQITGFVAAELGVSKQKLSLAESSSKLTKAGISSEDILLPAIQKYFESLKDKIPESTKTVQSAINELDAKWLSFKKDIVMSEKPEIIDFFHSLENGIKWLTQNENSILSIGKTLANLLKIYLEWRLAISAIQIPNAIGEFFNTEFDRVKGAFGINNKEHNDIVKQNSIITQSNKTLSKSFEELEFVENQAAFYENEYRERMYQSEIQYKENINLLNEQAYELNKLSISLGEVSIQTDLFTEAQIGAKGQGYLFTKSQIELTAATGLLNQNLALEAESLNIAAKAMNESILLKEKEAEAEALLNKELLEEEKLLESIAALGINQSKLNAEKGILGLSISAKNSSGIGSGVLGIGSALMTFAQKAIMPVMIMEFGAMALEQMGSSGKTDKGYSQGGVAHQLGEVFSFSFKNLKSEQYLSHIQDIVDKYGSTDLYKELIDHSKGFGYGGVIPFKDYLNSLIPLDKYGGRDVSDSSLINILQKDIKFRDVEAKAYFEEKVKPALFNYAFPNRFELEIPHGLRKVGDLSAYPKSERIKGNSIQNYYIHINEMSGMKNPKFTVENIKDMKEIQDRVGVIIMKFMNDTVQDATLLGQQKNH